jgi:hypothetical protein
VRSSKRPNALLDVVALSSVRRVRPDARRNLVNFAAREATPPSQQQQTLLAPCRLRGLPPNCQLIPPLPSYPERVWPSGWGLRRRRARRRRRRPAGGCGCKELSRGELAGGGAGARRARRRSKSVGVRSSRRRRAGGVSCRAERAPLDAAGCRGASYVIRVKELKWCHVTALVRVVDGPLQGVRNIPAWGYVIALISTSNEGCWRPLLGVRDGSNEGYMITLFNAPR